MERYTSRVSEAQKNILIEFLERNPNLARSRGYNNSARGRAESLRLWQEAAVLLNADGSGTSKSPKEWSVYVSNHKSKLKKIVADINSDVTGTGGGPPQMSERLSDWDKRFLSLLGPGFGQTAPQVMVQPFPSEQPSTSAVLTQSGTFEVLGASGDIAQSQEEPVMAEVVEEISLPMEDQSNRINNDRPIMPRLSRQRRQRTRPLAPLEEARRILSQIETQRLAADEANARAHEAVSNNLQHLRGIEYNLGRLADNLQPLLAIGDNLGRLASTAEAYLNYIISLRSDP